MIKTSARKEIKIPDIQGYQTLKCDFHMHTIFSDGIVWPTFRVDEAWEEGLDAIAITDHIENQPGKKYIGGDHNASYEIALPEAIEKNIILIRAGEITRKMPPGHLNALFVKDVNKINLPDATDALLAAKQQGAFIIWNHPGWKEQQPDTCLWMPMHQTLFEKGLINGIEVFNEKEYYPIVLDWCLSRKLAVICNSDIHDVINNSYDIANSHRPMTLVFSRERNAESIREALFENQTLAYFGNNLAGREDLLKAVFQASVFISPTGVVGNRKQKFYEIKNISAIPFELETATGKTLTLPANSSIIVALNPDDYRNNKILNLFIDSGENLSLSLNF
jgi:3',5'-nucleoside bisphosphate phosphatase